MTARQEARYDHLATLYCKGRLAPRQEREWLRLALRRQDERETRRSDSPTRVRGGVL